MAIDLLLEMASTIRKSTIPMTSSRLDLHYSRPDDAYFVRITAILARRRFPDARRSLADQLGYSIYLRRKRLLYQQRHEAKLAVPRSEPDAAPRETVPTQESVIQVDLTPRVAPKRPLPVAPIPLSLTQASNFDPSLLRKRFKNPTVISGRTAGALSRSEVQVEYPPIPVPDPGHKWCKCPYCLVPLKSTLLNQGQWRCVSFQMKVLKLHSHWPRVHVDKDLQPYVCISEKCQSPYQFFETQWEWKKHMESFHHMDWSQRVHMMTWTCDIGHETQLEFKSEDEFRKHFGEQHSALNGLRVNALARRNRGLGSREPLVCPMCETIPGEVTRTSSKGIKIQNFHNHIADHLKSLAFFSLPSPDSHPTENAEQSTFGHGSASSNIGASSRDELLSSLGSQESKENSTRSKADIKTTNSMEGSNPGIEDNTATTESPRPNDPGRTHKQFACPVQKHDEIRSDTPSCHFQGSSEMSAIFEHVNVVHKIPSTQGTGRSDEVEWVNLYETWYHTSRKIRDKVPSPCKRAYKCRSCMVIDSIQISAIIYS
jgi:hypothetical protein